jgi:transcription elongation factor GreA
MTRSPVTKAGMQKMVEKLRKLKEEELPNVVQELAEARASGGLGENTEYAEAWSRQQILEQRIAELEAQLMNARTVEPAPSSSEGKIVFGATVVVAQERTGRKSRFKIVGSEEADVGSGLLSAQSPFGRALIGAQVGDTVTVEAPAGTQEYTVLEVDYL